MFCNVLSTFMKTISKESTAYDSVWTYFCKKWEWCMKPEKDSDKLFVLALHHLNNCVT